MSRTDLAAQFTAAEQAFAAGRPAEAVTRLEAIERRLGGPVAAVLHLKGLAMRRMGRGAEGHAALVAAHRVDPAQPEIAANLGNSARDQGDTPTAKAAWTTALRLRPTMLAPRLALGAQLLAEGEFDAASRLYDAAPGVVAGTAGMLAARGAAARARGALEEAETLYLSACSAKPDHAAATHGRARTALERGRPEAPALYRTALALAPDDPERLLGLAQALDQTGDFPAGEALLTAALERSPAWIEGHRTLAQMRWEAGRRDDFTTSLETARRVVNVHIRPQIDRLEVELRHGVDDFAAAARIAAKAADDPGLTHADRRWFLLRTALAASEGGDEATADAALATLGLSDPDPDPDPRRAPGPGEALVAAYHALRRATGAAAGARAAAWLEPVVAAEPGNVSAWALLDLAWRLTGDARHDWLHGQPGLVATRPLALDPEALADIAAWLRGLHRTRAFPIGQSLRGGTQTRGALFDRWEPEAAMLRAAITAVVTAHRAALPPADPTHPLLAHRDRPTRFSGSWSVRLGEGGFHVAHIHSNGLLSSACYIVLPDVSGGDGVLEVGAPPRGLADGLGPLHVITPEVGQCALFPSTLYHGTRAFRAGERMSVAFDVAPG